MREVLGEILKKKNILIILSYRFTDDGFIAET